MKSPARNRGPWLLVATAVRRCALTIILGWLGLTALSNICLPSLEQVAKDSAVSLSVTDAPSVKAVARIGEVFKEANSDSVAIIVLEGDHPLGIEAHRYYDDLVRQLNADPAHVQHVQDFWADPLTTAGVQSADGKAAYVQVNLSGSQSDALAIESVAAVRKILQQAPAPDGIKAYATGPAPLIADMNAAGESGIVKVTAATVAVIFVMLLFVYRSIGTAVFLLALVGVELAAVRGIVALLGHFELVRVSTFAVTILVTLAIAAGTDYGIFFVGRYHEARQAGQDRQAAYDTAYLGVAHVILASGLTIAGAMYCLSFTRLPVFQTMGAACGVGMLVAVAVALTLFPAAITIAGRFGLLEPKRMVTARGWRRVGTAVARWPGPILLAAGAIALVGLLALPGHRVSYKDRLYLPPDTPANLGWAAAERHFSGARMMPEVLMVESGHDLRNSADFLVLDKLSKRLFGIEGVAAVQSVTRPEGRPLDHTSIPFLVSMQNAALRQSSRFVEDRLQDMRAQADQLTKTITDMEHAYTLMLQLSASSTDAVTVTEELTAITHTVRDDIADFDDGIRPLRNYAYWADNCFGADVCSALKSAYDGSDGLDQLTEKLDELQPGLRAIAADGPELATLLPGQITAMTKIQARLRTTHSTLSGIIGQATESTDDPAAMGRDFDAARNDDSFYLPRDVFANPDFQRVMKLFLSSDGHAARFVITHRGDPATPEGMALVDAMKRAAVESLKGTPLSGTDIYVAGTAALLNDLREGCDYDLMIAGVASLCLVFAVMLIITRSLIAALVIVGTVAASLGASFGLSVLLWQHILGIDLHWLVLVMSVIILLAVGSDYNLLLVARFKEELPAGLKTAIIRAMGGTGKVVTAAGLVFAITMTAMVVSDLRPVGQVGTTIGLGLLFDTLIVRSFMMPSVAALLGRWFWWPTRVHTRPPGRGCRQ